MLFNLITEAVDPKSFSYLVEESNKGTERSLYISGPYMLAETVNKNKRKYDLDNMISEVARYTKEFIKENRAIGELEHPQTAIVNSERACHLITELKQDGNTFIGKSKVLNTPMGKIVQCLINDGVKMGMSTRALGRLIQESSFSRVADMKLITVDCVADPSAPTAFVNGILESKQFILSSNGLMEEHYDNFEKKLAKLPRDNVNKYLQAQIINFINSIK